MLSAMPSAKTEIGAGGLAAVMMGLLLPGRGNRGFGMFARVGLGPPQRRIRSCPVMTTVSHDVGAAAKSHHQEEQAGPEQEKQDILQLHFSSRRRGDRLYDAILTLLNRGTETLIHVKDRNGASNVLGYCSPNACHKIQKYGQQA